MPGNTGDSHYDPAPWSSAAAAERLRTLIQQRHLSIAGLARALSVTRQTIHRWLQGQHISPNNLQRLSDYFKVDVVWLQNGSEKQPGDLIANQEELLDQLQSKLPISIFLVDRHRQLQSLATESSTRYSGQEFLELIQQAVDAALAGHTRQLSNGSVLVAAAPLDSNRDGHLAVVLLIDTAALEVSYPPVP